MGTDIEGNGVAGVMTPSAAPVLHSTPPPQIVPEGFIGVRLRVRSAKGGGIIAIRAESNDGPLLGSVVVPCTVPATSMDGEPDWAVGARPHVFGAPCTASTHEP